MAWGFQDLKKFMVMICFERVRISKQFSNVEALLSNLYTIPLSLNFDAFNVRIRSLYCILEFLTVQS